MNHRASGNQNGRTTRISRRGDSSDLTDMKALAAAETARPPSVPPLRPRAPELSGIVGRRGSVVGARIDDRASLLAGLSWLWVSAGCAAVLVPGLIGVWLLVRSSPAPAAPSTAMVQPAAPKVAAPTPVEIEPLAHLPAMMPEPEAAAVPEPRAYPSGRYYHRRRGGQSRRAAAAALAAMTGGSGAAPAAPGAAGSPPLAAGAASPPGNAADEGSGVAESEEAADEPEKAPEKPKRVVEAAPDEPTTAPPRTVNQLRSALARLQGRVVQCHQRFQVDGVADVKVAVNPSGTVESASLAGEFEGTPTGDCIVRAVSAASFPTFDGTESVRVSHSFPLQ
jgi:hypothetical protein